MHLHKAIYESRQGSHSGKLKFLAVIQFPINFLRQAGPQLNKDLGLRVLLLFVYALDIRVFVSILLGEPVKESGLRFEYLEV